MRPQQARRDWTNLPPACNDAATYPSASRDCEFGDPQGSRTVVLVGDSHAKQWLPAVQGVAKERRWKLRVYFLGGCSFLDARVTALGGRAGDYRECREWRERVLARLRELRPDAVLIGRYAGYVNRILLPGGGRSDADTVADPWRAAAGRTFSALADVSRTTIVLRDNPWPPGDIPACLAKRGATAARCAFPARGHVRADEPLHRAELAASRRLGDSVVFLDPTRVICPSTRCPVITRDGTIVYRDNNHVTATFAATMAGWFGQQLGPVVERS
jgi:hypothetical protein